MTLAKSWGKLSAHPDFSDTLTLAEALELLRRRKGPPSGDVTGEQVTADEQRETVTTDRQLERQSEESEEETVILSARVRGSMLYRLHAVDSDLEYVREALFKGEAFLGHDNKVYLEDEPTDEAGRQQTPQVIGYVEFIEAHLTHRDWQAP